MSVDLLKFHWFTIGEILLFVKKYMYVIIMSRNYNLQN